MSFHAGQRRVYNLWHTGLSVIQPQGKLRGSLALSLVRIVGIAHLYAKYGFIPLLA